MPIRRLRLQVCGLWGDGKSPAPHLMTPDSRNLWSFRTLRMGFSVLMDATERLLLQQNGFG